MDKKLSAYAKEQGITYKAAWLRWKAGKIKGAYQDESGHVWVPETTLLPEPRVAVYARVSSTENKANLKSQAERLCQYSTAKGWQIVHVVEEVGSGVNDHRKQLMRLLKQDDWNIVLVEHKDRLTRCGFNYLETLLRQGGKRIEVVNLAQDDQSDLMDDLIAVIYSFAARMYGLRRTKKRTEKILACLREEGGQVERGDS